MSSEPSSSTPESTTSTRAGRPPPNTLLDYSNLDAYCYHARAPVRARPSAREKIERQVCIIANDPGRGARARPAAYDYRGRARSGFS